MSAEFLVKATWTSTLKGHGRLFGRGLEVVHSAPSELGGAGIGTNPEELLVSAAASCFLVTLGAILDRRGIAVSKVELESAISVSPSLVVESIVHRPRISLAAAGDDAQAQAQALDAAHRAEKVCLVANAMRGNVTVRVEPQIVTG